jgi:hypothetical protein
LLKSKTKRVKDLVSDNKKPKASSRLVSGAVKKTSLTVAVSPVRKLAKLEKQTELLKKAGTTFGVPSKQLYSMIQEGKIDQAVVFFQRQMLATILRLIPIAEKQYRREKKEHTAYALNSLVSQARELTADIQSSADRAAVAEVIVTDVLMPTFRSFIETVVIETQTLKSAPSHRPHLSHKQSHATAYRLRRPLLCP